MGLTQEIGDKGEQAAAGWLTDNGFTLLHRNWRNGRYELDIVAKKNGVIHFVEVKCRRLGGLTTPEEAATRKKFRSLMKAAEAYLEAYGIDAESQFDLISVEHSETGNDIRYIPNAMVPEW